ncbi:MAG: DNA alkylation repair protein [Labilithrix sp.]|nr:DNA alkylation repair protein [Labilithrix sp.]
MADPLKEFFSPALVARLGRSLASAHPAFPEAAFVRDATRGLARLELLARSRHITRAMRAHLPAEYREAVAILLRSLGPMSSVPDGESSGMAPFFYLPHATFVGDFGLDDFETSMRAQHAITQRFSCEFSIRGYLERYPDETLEVMKRWAADPSAHVRRLVSEGTRPLLPWATRVRWLVERPERLLPLLEALKDDPASAVRRSVANHLNDLSKSDPDRVAAIARRWLRSASPERRALVEHALRSSVKRGHRPTLEVLGFGERPRVAVSNARFSPARVAVGDKVRIDFEIAAARGASRTQALVVDLVVHFVKARGQSSPKVFKITRLDLAPKGRAALGKSVSLAVHTTRKPNPGVHHVDVLVNGERFELGAFRVQA